MHTHERAQENTVLAKAEAGQMERQQKAGRKCELKSVSGITIRTKGLIIQ